MARCLRRPTIRLVPLAVDPGTTVDLESSTAAFSLRAVSAAGAGVAFTVALEDFTAQAWHFAAGEGWSERDLKLDDVLKLRVVPDAAGRTLELITWE